MANQDIIEAVYEFNRKFGIERPPTPVWNPEVLEFKIKHLKEELLEIEDAESLAEIADGLIDIIYVALGACYALGLPTRRLFDAVHEANMSKRRASSERESKRGSSLDIVKPEGWTPADVEGILKEAGL